MNRARVILHHLAGFRIVTKEAASTPFTTQNLHLLAGGHHPMMVARPA
jgi:hypothetical protein